MQKPYGGLGHLTAVTSARIQPVLQPRRARNVNVMKPDTMVRGTQATSVRQETFAVRGADSTKFPKLECVHALNGLALPCASHYGEIALAGSRRLRSTLPS